LAATAVRGEREVGEEKRWFTPLEFTAGRHLLQPLSQKFLPFNLQTTDGQAAAAPLPGRARFFC